MNPLGGDGEGFLLFYGTGIPACIIVLDKENAAARSAIHGGGIFMINASQGFMKDGNKNRLRHQDLHKMVDVFTRQLETPKYARLVPLAEIEANDYNLNIPRYIDNSAEEEVQDITAHLLGGIPQRDVEALSAYWQVFPSLGGELFAPAGREGYSLPRVAAAQVKAAIFSHAEFRAFNARMTGLFQHWQAQNKPLLTGLGVDCKPKALIENLSESLLASFAGAPPLLDQYDLYQRLMTYWAETMQDDVYLISSDGWQEAGRLRLMVEDENKKSKEKADFAFGKRKYKADLIPPALMVRRYFAAEQSALEAMKAGVEALAGEMEALKEEHGGEEGLLAEAQDEKGSISKGSLAGRLKEIRHDREAGDERKVLEAYLALIEKESEAARMVKDAQKALDERVAAKYGVLSEAEIKTLVINDKWLASLAAEVAGELERVSQALTGRIKELTERYAAPLPQITQEVVASSNKVDAHLHKMGLVW